MWRILEKLAIAAMIGYAVFYCGWGWWWLLIGVMLINPFEGQ